MSNFLCFLFTFFSVFVLLISSMDKYSFKTLDMVY
jgi:hypothetical protein